MNCGRLEWSLKDWLPNIVLRSFAEDKNFVQWAAKACAPSNHVHLVFLQIFVVNAQGALCFFHLMLSHLKENGFRLSCGPVSGYDACNPMQHWLTQGGQL